MGCHAVYNAVDIFVLASQYFSHSVVPDRAAHRCRCFLSMASCRPHNMQKGLSRRPSDEGALRPVFASNGVAFLQMRLVGSHNTSGREKKGKKERTGLQSLHISLTKDN